MTDRGTIATARLLRRDMTDAEKKIWGLLRNRQFEALKFRRQVPFGHYIADFASHQTRLVIEIDGGQHAMQIQKDAARTQFLESQGYTVLRFWNNEVLTNIDGVWAVIAAACGRHHPHPTARRIRLAPSRANEKDGVLE